jgi:DNA-directed RNA polymerase subunit RPC12/RpoP
MKMIEKTCPNCGANIEFNKGDEKVKCEYCKKSYVIEEDKENANDYTLVTSKEISKIFVIMFAFSSAFIILIVLLMTFGVAPGVKHLAEEQIGDRYTPINSFDDISNDTINKIHKKSIEIISNDTNITSTIYEQKEPFENKGMYLLIFDGGSTIYDVYKAKYQIRGEIKDIYCAYRYEDVNKNANNLYGQPMPNTNPKSEGFMLGYTSEEELYNSLVKTVKANKVMATDGMYIETN